MGARRARQHHCPLNDVLKLAHVARIGVRPQRGRRALNGSAARVGDDAVDGAGQQSKAEIGARDDAGLHGLGDRIGLTAEHVRGR